MGGNIDDNASMIPTSSFMPKIGVDVEPIDGGLFGDIDLAGIGSIASAIGSIWGQSELSSWRKRQEKREVQRQKREEKRQDKFESNMQKAYK